jgi:hypothetical protein
MTVDRDETEIGRGRLSKADRRLSNPAFRGGGGGKFIGDWGLLDEKDIPESLMEVTPLMAETTPTLALVGGVPCVSDEEVFSTEDKMEDSVADVGRWLLGGE